MPVDGVNGGRRRKRMDCGVFATVCVAMCSAGTALAQEPSVELRIPSRTLELGEAVEAQLVCTNTARPELPEIQAPPGLDVQVTNAIPFSSSQTSIINGRVSQRTEFTFPVRITARREGGHTIPPITVVAGDATYRTSPVQIVVRKPEAAGGPKGDRYLFVELSVDRESLYVTETLVATLVLGIRKVQIGGRVYDLDLLREVLDVRGSQLAQFAGGTASRSERWLTDSEGSRHAYEVFRVQQEIEADRPGELLIGPVFLKARYPTALRRGFFGRLEVSQAEQVTARADAIAVQVKTPPLDDRPEDFTDSIGQFTMEVSARPLRVEKGQPVTLTITIGGGPLESAAGPDLSRQPELASRFDFVQDELVGDIEDGTKVFRRAVFPKQVGAQTIPPISWSYFDPKSERYVTLTSDPIAITVDPPSGATEALSLSPSDNGSKPSGTALTLLDGGLSPNYVDPGEVLVSQTFSPASPVVVAALIVPPLFCVGVGWGVRYRGRLRGDVGFARRRGARRRALSAIRQALAARDGQDRVQAIANALAGYLADRYNLPPGQLTADEVRTLLNERGLDGEVAAEIARFLHASEATRFMPGSGEAPSAEEAAERAREWIGRLERVSA